MGSGQGLGGGGSPGNGGECLVGTRFPFEGHKVFWDWTGVVVAAARHHEGTKCH